eukprot:g2920.t1
MGNKPSNTLQGQPDCARCGKNAHGGTSRACRLCGTVYCGACKKLHMIKALDEEHGKEERWKCAHNPLCRIKAKALEAQSTTGTAIGTSGDGGGIARIQWQRQDPETQLWHSLDEDANAKVEADRIGGQPEAIVSINGRTMRLNFADMLIAEVDSSADSGAGTDADSGTQAGAPTATAVQPPQVVRRYVRVRMSDFITHKVLGRGAEGKVLLVQKQAVPGEADPSANKLFAMKVLKKDTRQEGDENWRERMWTERNILANIDHPFLTRLRYAFETRGGLHLVMDLYQGGELFVHLSKMRRLEVTAARFYIVEMLLALDHLHALDIVYRDIKPENVLLDRRGHVRLTDFGLSKQLISPAAAATELTGADMDKLAHANSFVGSPEYIAPEVLRREPYGKAADWWGLGAVLFEMLFGRPPFMHESRAKLFRMILQQPLSEVFDAMGEGNRRRVEADESGVGAHAFTLLDGLMRKSQQERLGTHWRPGDELTTDSSCTQQRRPSRRGSSTNHHLGAEGSLAIRQHAFFDGVDFNRALARGYEPPFIPTVEDDHDLRNFDFTFTSEVVDRRGATQSSRGGLNLSSLDLRGDEDRRFENFTYVDDRDDSPSRYFSGKGRMPVAVPAPASVQTVVVDGGIGVSATVKPGVVDGPKQSGRRDSATVPPPPPAAQD